MTYLKIFILLCFSVAMTAQTVWTVNSTDDIDDGACTLGHCSLREALIAANLNGGPDSIIFNIPGAGAHTILLTSALPGIEDADLIINGTSQPGNNPMAGFIRIDGSNLSGNADHGLVIYIRRVKVYGLQIQNFPGSGIQIFGGFVDDPHISDLVIGAPQRGNVIISNGAYGIEGPVDQDVSIQGNYIGTDLNFIVGQGNGWDGLFLNILSGSNVQIGGSRMTGEENYFCSNVYSGARLAVADPTMFQPGFSITGNVFGTGAGGVENLGNQGFTTGMVTQDGGGLFLVGDGPMAIGGAGMESNVFAFNTNGIVVSQFNRKRILSNQFYCNSGKGISLLNGGNDNLGSPHSLCYKPGTGISGFATPSHTVHLYSQSNAQCAGAPCQGLNLIASTTADASGVWSFNNAFQPGMNFTTLAEDAIGNSSEFSECIRAADSIAVVASNTGPYCTGDAIQLEALVPPALPNPSFQWSGPGGYSSTMQNPTNATEPGQYVVVVTAGGCVSDSARTQVIFNQPDTGYIRDFCLGDSFLINGNVYNLFNLFGTEILPGATVNGCDSVVIIDLNLNASLELRFFYPLEVCRGETVVLTFVELLGFNIGPIDFVLSDGINPPDTLYNMVTGDTIHRIAEETVQYIITEVLNVNTICEPILSAGETMVVSELIVDGTVSDYDGFGVSCFGANDGAIQVDILSGAAPYDYFWSTPAVTDAGSTTLESGSYSVTITDSLGCREQLDFLLTEPESFGILLDVERTTCRGALNGTIIVDTISRTRDLTEVSLDGAGFTPVNTYPIIYTDLPGGAHLLEIRDGNGCIQEIPIFIPEGPPVNVDLGSNVSIEAGDSAQLNFVSDITPNMITWTPSTVLTCTSCPDPIAFPEVTTTVGVQIMNDEGCIAEDSIRVEVFIPKRVYIPNAFTPNDDNTNDFFFVSGDPEFVEIIEYIGIVDRKGSLVFETTNIDPNDPSVGWDGTFIDEPVLPGVYMYHIKVRFVDLGQGGRDVFPYTGTVTVIR